MPSWGHALRIFYLNSEVLLPRPVGEIFAFFGDAGNLNELTPSWLRFSVVTPQPVEMRVGAVIDYKLRIHGIPIRWRSEITTWEPPHRFVDEQRRGPYRRWVHEHRFESCAEGTRVIDEVRYAVPGGVIVHKLFVGPDLRRIFGYRRERLVERFGSSGPAH